MAAETTGSREGKAGAMLAAFASIGARSFDVTITDIQGERVSFQITGP
jgi:hypothetical protein